MTEHGVKDARHHQARAHGGSHTLPPGYKIQPDPRRNTRTPHRFVGPVAKKDLPSVPAPFAPPAVSVPVQPVATPTRKTKSRSDKE